MGLSLSIAILLVGPESPHLQVALAVLHRVEHVLGLLLRHLRRTAVGRLAFLALAVFAAVLPLGAAVAPGVPSLATLLAAVGLPLALALTCVAAAAIALAAIPAGASVGAAVAAPVAASAVASPAVLRSARVCWAAAVLPRVRVAAVAVATVWRAGVGRILL